MRSALAAMFSLAALGLAGFVVTEPTPPQDLTTEEVTPVDCKPAGASCANSGECCGICVFTNDEGKGVCQGG